MTHPKRHAAVIAAKSRFTKYYLEKQSIVMHSQDDSFLVLIINFLMRKYISHCAVCVDQMVNKLFKSFSLEIYKTWKSKKL